MGRRRWSVVVDEPFKKKYVAYALDYGTNDNMVWFCRGHKTVQLMPSKQKAVELAEYWNSCYKENGTALEW